MTASSVTGVGPGDSHGLQKKENHCGCPCCGGTPTETVSNPPVKRGCVTNYSVGRSARYASGGKASSIKVC